MTDIKNKNISGYFMILSALIVSVVGLILLTASYEIGAHNSDLAQNMKILEQKFGVSLYDIGSDFTSRDLTELYIVGQNKQKEAHYFSIFFAIIFGMCFMYLLNKREKNK